jgi:hypothetical protein
LFLLLLSPSVQPSDALDPYENPGRIGLRKEEKDWDTMNTQLLLEEKHVLLKHELGEKLQKKHALELEITRQFEELKRLEISLEKHPRPTKLEQ